MDSSGSFPGNSEEEVAVSQVKDLWVSASSFLAWHGCGLPPPPKSCLWPPWGGPCRPSCELLVAAL